MGCVWFIYRNMELRHWLVPANVKNNRINYLHKIVRSLSSSFICHTKIQREGVVKFTMMARRPQETTRLITEATSAVINK